MRRRDAWIVWAAAIPFAAVASLVLWWVGGQAACGEEDYDTPPGSLGDTFCRNLVEPVLPWAVVAALPFLSVLVVGFVGARAQNKRLLVVAVVGPLAVAIVSVFAALSL
jgi:hypothetical protein